MCRFGQEACSRWLIASLLPIPAYGDACLAPIALFDFSSVGTGKFGKVARYGSSRKYRRHSSSVRLRFATFAARKRPREVNRVSVGTQRDPIQV